MSVTLIAELDFYRSNGTNGEPFSKNVGNAFRRIARITIWLERVRPNLSSRWRLCDGLFRTAITSLMTVP